MGKYTPPLQEKTIETLPQPKPFWKRLFIATVAFIMIFSLLAILFRQIN